MDAFLANLRASPLAFLAFPVLVLLLTSVLLLLLVGTLALVAKLKLFGTSIVATLLGLVVTILLVNDHFTRVVTWLTGSSAALLDSFSPSAGGAADSPTALIVSGFVLLAVWAVSGQVIGAIIANIRDDNYQFVIVFTLGLFLSVSAVSTIETFTTVSEYADDELPELRALFVSGAEETFQSRLPATSAEVLNTVDVTKVNELRGEFDTYWTNAVTRYNRVLGEFRVFAASLDRVHRSLVDAQVQNFREIVQSPIRPYDQYVYLLRLRETIASSGAFKDGQMQVLAGELDAIRDEMQGWLADVDLLQMQAEPPPLAGFNRQLERARDSLTSVTLLETQNSVVGGNIHGANLGAYSFTRWLHTINSLELVLITGMLGFGLLGAAAYSFVRHQQDTGPGLTTHPLVKDPLSIIISGVSAAIVIFLAVKGGLAVFSVGTAEVNPYALFFTCIAAAVFNETAWRWASTRFSNSLSVSKGPSQSDSAAPSAQ